MVWSVSQIFVVDVVISPETWIIAPYVTREQLQRWRALNWIDDEGLHLDRAFPRNADGKPVILKLWLRAAMIRACRQLYSDKSSEFETCRAVVNSFSIVDESLTPVEYIVISDQPLRYRRSIGGTKSGSRAGFKTEFFEYIDSTYRLRFLALTDNPKLFAEILQVAGKIGLLAKTKWGYGKFRVVSVDIKPIESWKKRSEGVSKTK